MILMNIYIVMKRVKAINICAQRERERVGVVRTIKAQYYKNSLANFIRKDGLGATAVMEYEI